MELRREDAERVAFAGGETARELLLVLFDPVAEQGEELEKIQRRLGENSRNSSLPPSSDRGQAPKRPPRKKSERKQGGQPGHEGTARGLISDPDETVEHRPERCRKLPPRSVKVVAPASAEVATIGIAVDVALAELGQDLAEGGGDRRNPPPSTSPSETDMKAKLSFRAHCGITGLLEVRDRVNDQRCAASAPPSY